MPLDRWRQHSIVVAVSGGADSVALFRTLEAMVSSVDQPPSQKIIVGHVDHGLRGQASHDDRTFVKELALKFGVRFASATLDLPTMLNDRQKPSEDLLRDARYGALRKMAQQNGARYLFTGHHLDDQVETILFRIFRGTGLVGLKGIPAVRCDDWLTIVRPFLKTSKAKILETMAAIDQPFRFDHTNATNEFGRNFIRNEILAQARSYFGPQVDQSIARLADHASDAVDQEASLVDQYFCDAPPQVQSGTVVVKTPSLSSQPTSLVRAILIRLWRDQGWAVSQMTFDRWQSLASRICGVNDSSLRDIENLPGNLRIEIDCQRVSITSDQDYSAGQ